MKMISLAIAAFAAATAVSNAQVRVTEYSHKGLFGEYFEVSNLGSSVSLNGWKFNDNSGTFSTGVALPNVTLNTNDTVIVTEVSQDVFEQAWFFDRSATVPTTLVGYVANSTRNLGKTDEIRIYNSGGGAAVDTVSITTGMDTEDHPAVLNALRTAFVFADTVGGQFKAGVPGANGPTGSPGVVAP